MNKSTAEAIRGALADMPPEWVECAIDQASQIPLEGDDKAQARALASAVVAAIKDRIAEMAAETGALNAQTQRSLKLNEAIARMEAMDIDIVH